jgi:hypothetical protein
METKAVSKQSTVNACQSSPIDDPSSTECPSLLEPASPGASSALERLQFLLVASGKQARESARNAQVVHEAEVRVADEKRFAEMRSKASEALLSGLITSGVQFAAATANVVACSVELSSMAANHSAEKALDAASSRLKDAEGINKVADRVRIDGTVERLSAEKGLAEAVFKDTKYASELASGTAKNVGYAGQAADAAGKAVGVIFKARADQADEQIGRLETQSRAATRAAERAEQELQHARDSDGKLQSLMKEIVGNRDQTLRMLAQRA